MSKISLIEYASDVVGEICAPFTSYNILLSKRQSTFAIDVNIHKILYYDVYVVIRLWAQYRGGAIRDE